MLRILVLGENSKVFKALKIDQSKYETLEKISLNSDTSDDYLVVNFAWSVDKFRNLELLKKIPHSRVKYFFQIRSISEFNFMFFPPKYVRRKREQFNLILNISRVHGFKLSQVVIGLILEAGMPWEYISKMKLPVDFVTPKGTLITNLDEIRSLFLRTNDYEKLKKINILGRFNGSSPSLKDILLNHSISQIIYLFNSNGKKLEYSSE
jgi:hypothetical protein